MTHYICLGGCEGVSEERGVCKTETCPKHNILLEKCECEDGKHYGREKKES